MHQTYNFAYAHAHSVEYHHQAVPRFLNILWPCAITNRKKKKKNAVCRSVHVFMLGCWQHPWLQKVHFWPGSAVNQMLCLQFYQSEKNFPHTSSGLHSLQTSRLLYYLPPSCAERHRACSCHDTASVLYPNQCPVIWHCGAETFLEITPTQV